MTSRISFSPDSSIPSASHHLIFFITGNPGLIGYYNTFLRTLYQLLSEGADSSSSKVFHVYGESLAGFEEDDTPSKETGCPYVLEDQIDARLLALKDQRISTGPRQGDQYDSMILIGHSVGSYILLEMLQRLRNSSSSVNVRAGILLMPTVMGIAESSSGVMLSSLFRIPGFAKGGSLLAKGLLWPISKPMVKWLVGTILRMPEEGAQVTANFLKSSMGIWQAL